MPPMQVRKGLLVESRLLWRVSRAALQYLWVGQICLRVGWECLLEAVNPLWLLWIVQEPQLSNRARSLSIRRETRAWLQI